MDHYLVIWCRVHFICHNNNVLHQFDILYPGFLNSLNDVLNDGNFINLFIKEEKPA